MAAKDKGTLEILDGGTLETESLAVGRAGDGIVRLEGSGSRIEIISNRTDTEIGQNESGLIEILNGGLFTSVGDVIVGAPPIVNTNSGPGTLRVLGATSVLEAANIFVGKKSVGEFFVDAAANVVIELGD